MSNYDRLSGWYDLLAEGSEGRLRRKALEMLYVQCGEQVLEIGCGTGRGLVELASAGGAGRVVGVDLSTGMLRQTHQRILRIVNGNKPSLVRADGLDLPFPPDCFKVVFLSFTLELFEDRQRKEVLAEIRRVLKLGGRLGVVALAAENRGWMERAYRWAHRTFPNAIDCCPIALKRDLEQNGWQIAQIARYSMWGLPVTIAIASKN